MLPGKIERQMAVHRRHPGLGLSFTDFQVVDAAGRVLKPSFLREYDTLWKIVARGVGESGGLDRASVYCGLLAANFIGTSGVAVRSDVLDDVGAFDESLASCEDLDLWLRISRRYDCAYVDTVGHAYRRHPSSVMHEVSPVHPRARIAVLERQLGFPTDAQAARIIRSKLALNYTALGYVFELAGDRARARENYCESLRRRPSWGAAWGWLKALVGAPAG